VRVTDKLPDNLYNLGLIATMFPNARIVFCYRDGRDASLSVFFQRFSQRVSFSTDLLEAGRRWRDARRMSAFWAKTLPFLIHNVHYETLVGDFEAEARKLVAFLGVEWEDNCLHFYRTDRNVKTASQWQVCQPLYKGSVGRWRNYRSFIGPLCEAIEIDIDAPDGAPPKNLT
jgi:Sulfotransferase family